MDDQERESIISQIHSLCPCRETQVQKLLELFGEEDEFSCPNVFVYGHTGTGKSHVLKHTMKLLKLKHVFVNCIECHSSKLLFEAILDGMGNYLDCEVDLPRKYDNFNDFLRCLRLVAKNGLEHEKFYIILDNAERLRNMNQNLLPGFMKLFELSELEVCVIFVTEINLEKFLSGTCFPLPVQVYFDDYSQKDLIKIMSLDCPNGFTSEFYATYCQLVISVFHLVCKDLNELKYLAILNFAKYCEPLEKDKSADMRKLWRNIEPQLKKCLSTVYLREVSSARWEEMQQNNAIEFVKAKLTLELPYLSKYLLIAAYIASHNPSRTDRRLFCKETHGKMSKRAKTSAKAAPSDWKLSGPKAFPLDRLLAIFFCILEEDIDPNASLLTQISSLVNLRLLAKVSADDLIDLSKYKCLVDFHFIKSVAENVGFNLEQYLFEAQ